MQQNKMRVVVYVPPAMYVEMVHYGERNAKKNMSAVFEGIFYEWKRYEAIYRRIKIQEDLKKIDDQQKNAEVVKL